MRVLVTALPAGSHLRAVVPLAQTLRRREHEVRVAYPAELRAEIASYCLGHVEAGAPWGADRDSADTLETEVGRSTILGDGLWWRTQQVLAVARQWRPHLIVRDSLEFAGCLVGEALDIPHVSVGHIGGATARPFPINPSTRAAMDGHRAALGLSPDPELLALDRFLHVNTTPYELDPGAARGPNARSYRHTYPVRSNEELPSWIAELTPDRPFILAAMGTAHPMMGDWLAAIVGGLAMLRCWALVATGRSSGVHALGPRPAHVVLAKEVPQTLLLECCDLLVSHGGAGSIREALRAGVPMVLIPQHDGDPPENALRCARAGVARVLSPSKPDRDEVAGACRTVLEEPSYRRAARDLQRRMLALPSLDSLAAELEERFG